MTKPLDLTKMMNKYQMEMVKYLFKILSAGLIGMSIFIFVPWLFFYHGDINMASKAVSDMFLNKEEWGYLIFMALYGTSLGILTMCKYIEVTNNILSPDKSGIEDDPEGKGKEVNQNPCHGIMKMFGY